MNKQEETLKKAFEKITPDVWDAIKNDIENEERTRTVMAEEPETSVGKTLVLADDRADKTETVRRSKTLVFRRFAAAAAVLVLLIGGVVGFNGYNVAKTVAATISLDVNPSIEINTNAKDRVLSVKALNEDAETVIGDMDFEGADLDVAVNALIGSLLRHGYLDEYKNSILVSVDNRDKDKGEAMRLKLLDEINGILKQDGIEGAVLSRISDDDDALEELAEKYGITEGKAALIQDIIAGKPGYSFEDLAKLTINELNLISESPAVELSHLQSEGKASDKAYVGEDKAVEAVLAAAGLDRSQISGLKSEIDYDNGAMVYEVEFVSGGVEYEYEINASTGEVVKAESESGSDIENDPEYDDTDDDDDEDTEDLYEDQYDTEDEDDYDTEDAYDSDDDHEDYDDDHDDDHDDDADDDDDEDDEDDD
ncbi:MAG: PepSY domain-containing protein [Firmicutes bacterium]|nr:PepSY domain-containing protein [Bacillota bacterium]